MGWQMVKLMFAATVATLAATDITGLTAPFGSLGITGLLAWYIIWDVKYTRPANEERLERMVLNSEAKHDQLAAQFTESLTEERNLRREMHEAFKCQAPRDS